MRTIVTTADAYCINRVKIGVGEGRSKLVVVNHNGWRLGGLTGNKGECVILFAGVHADKAAAVGVGLAEFVKAKSIR